MTKTRMDEIFEDLNSIIDAYYHPLEIQADELKAKIGKADKAITKARELEVQKELFEKKAKNWEGILKQKDRCIALLKRDKSDIEKAFKDPTSDESTELYEERKAIEQQIAAADAAVKAHKNLLIKANISLQKQDTTQGGVLASFVNKIIGNAENLMTKNESDIEELQIKLANATSEKVLEEMDREIKRQEYGRGETQKNYEDCIKKSNITTAEKEAEKNALLQCQEAFKKRLDIRTIWELKETLSALKHQFDTVSIPKAKEGENEGAAEDTFLNYTQTWLIEIDGALEGMGKTKLSECAAKIIQVTKAFTVKFEELQLNQEMPSAGQNWSEHFEEMLKQAQVMGHNEGKENVGPNASWKQKAVSPSSKTTTYRLF